MGISIGVLAGVLRGGIRDAPIHGVRNAVEVLPPDERIAADPGRPRRRRPPRPQAGFASAGASPASPFVRGSSMGMSSTRMSSGWIQTTFPSSQTAMGFPIRL
jgi:hypothetical protein